MSLRKPGKIESTETGEDDPLYSSELINSVSDAIISTDAKGIITSWNKAAEKLYGWTAGESIGRKGSEFLETEFYQNVSPESILKEINEKGKWVGELVQRKKDGERIQVYATSILVKDRTGNLVGGISIIHKDITERRKLKEESEQVLQETRDLLTAILNNTHVLIACLDTNFNFIVVNENYSRSDGRSPEYYIGKNHFSLFPNAENEKIFRACC